MTQPKTMEMKPMEEKSQLKTLKDLTYEAIDPIYNHCNLSELKREAIKWVKLIDKELENLLPRNLDNLYEKKTGLVATGEWIKMFFNITEEDLE